MIDYFQQQARSTAIYPHSQKFIYPVLELMGEFGEATEKLIPPQVMENDTVTVDKDEATKEIGDCLWALANAAFDADLSLVQLSRDLTNGLEVTSFKALGFALTEPRDPRRLFLLMMIAIGELAEIAKKAIRDNGGTLQETKQFAVRRALGTCLRAWLQICAKYKIDPDDAAIVCIEKVTRRKDEGKLHGDGDNR